MTILFYLGILGGAIVGATAFHFGFQLRGVSLSSSRPAFALSRRVSLQWARLVTAASSRAQVAHDRFAAWCRETFGEVEFVVGDFCEVCMDVHAPNVMCPRAVSGQCAICPERVILDRFGNCPTPRGNHRTHVISNRRAATEAEWRRPRLIKGERLSPAAR